MPPTSAPGHDPALSYGSIAVVGAGAWGTALAIVAAGNAAKIVLWARENEIVETVTAARENAMYLPGVRLPDNIEATGNLGDAGGADAVLLVAPAQHLRGVLTSLRGTLAP